MAVFPSLNPSSSRTYSPGDYPHTVYRALNGVESRVRHSSAMVGSEVRLSFSALSESDMLSILSHYQGQLGSYFAFALPSIAFAGMVDATVFTLSRYQWRYQAAPVVRDLPCGTHTVDVQLVSVAPEPVAAQGARLVVVASLALSPAVTTSGLNATITASIEHGAAEAAGLEQTVTVTMAAGTATGNTEALGAIYLVPLLLLDGTAAAANGLERTVTVSIAGGAATAGSSQTGSTQTVTVSLAAGAASGIAPFYLLHFDGSNNSTTFTDSSSNGYSSTAFGNAIISTAQNKFGGASGYFDGNGDYIRTAYNSNWNLSSGEFTIECWFRANALAGVLIAKDKYGSSFDWCIEIVNSTTIRCYTNGTSNSFAVTVPTMSTGVWYHVALVRRLVGSTYTNYMYLDGVSYGSNTMSITNASQDYISIGCAGWNNPNSFFNGYIDELRVTKSAVYSANFTPPTAAFPNP